MARRNPVIPLWAWLAGGAVVAGGVGYLIYKNASATSGDGTQQAAGGSITSGADGSSIATLAPGDMSAPTGFVTMVLPTNATWVSVSGGNASVSAGTADQVTANLVAGSPVTAVWNDGTSQQTTTITAS
jgi:hypothetical protein